MDTRQIRIADYDYPLPDRLIARYPLAQRDSCRLLVSRPGGQIEHARFSDLPSLLPTDALMVSNNTRVINARLRFRKPTGASIEVMLLDPLQPSDYALVFQQTSRVRWKAMVGNLKRWKGERLCMTLAGGDTLCAELAGDADGNAKVVDLSWSSGREFADVLAEAGRIPIPPYLRRESQQSDAADYQTLFAKIKGSVAAPTAGLHFTPEVMEGLKSRGIECREVTLHVGAGTFLPVKADSIGDHPMHTEIFHVDLPLLEALIGARESGRPVVAVGTTTVRTLESLPYLPLPSFDGTLPEVTQWQAYTAPLGREEALAALRRLRDHLLARDMAGFDAATSIMIAPGFGWNVVDALVTNFHQPQSTLLLLVSSFLHPRSWRRIYDEALREEYRFLSYGDACLFL